MQYLTGLLCRCTEQKVTIGLFPDYTKMQRNALNSSIIAQGLLNDGNK